MIKNSLLSCLFALLFFCSARAQIVVSGLVTDNQTKEALAGASICIDNSTIGTLSNNSGEFKLRIPAEYTGRNLIFASIGYQSDSISIESFSRYGVEIGLKQLPINIEAVVVRPDDWMRTLLTDAYARIADNYNTEPTLLSGFYREYTQNDAGDYYYFSEAVIESRLNSYRHKDKPQIRIIKSMANEFPVIEEFKYRVVNGPFSATTDFVKERIEFIDPNHYTEYFYELETITEFNGSAIYVISFHPKNEHKSGLIGKLYIDVESLAYIRAEWEGNNTRLKRLSMMHYRGVPIHSNKSVVQFAESVDRKMYLKYSSLYTDLENINYRNEYVTTEQQTDSIESLPYVERLYDFDVFLTKAQEYQNESYWDEYNVLKRDSVLNEQLKVHFDVEQSRRLLSDQTYFIEKSKKSQRRERFINTLTKFGVRYSVRGLSASSDQGFYELSIIDSPIVLSQTFSSSRYIPASTMQIDYRINKLWSINGVVSSSFGKDQLYDSYELGTTYEFLLNRWSKPWVGELSFFCTRNTMVRNFNMYNNSETVDLFNKKFDADRLRFGIGYVSSGFSPRFGIKHQLTNRLWVYGNAGIYLPILTTQRLSVSEKSGFFLSRKTISGDLNDREIKLTYNGTQTTESHIELIKWNFSIGIAFQY